jgi:hypothetical protein
MKRRDFLMASGGFAAVALPGLARAATPCPPPTFSVSGQTVTTACGSVASGTFTTNFPLTENPISQGGIWQNGGVGGTMPYGNVQTVSGRAMADRYIGLNDGYPDSSAILNPVHWPFNADQWAEVTVYHDPAYTPTSSHEVIIALRGTVNVNGPYHYPHYHVLFTLGGFQLFWLNGVMGNFTEISATTHNGGLAFLKTGDVLRAEIQGTAIRVYQNTVLKYSATDASIATGQPGPMFFVREQSGQDYSRFCISRFRCGNL